MSKKDRKAIEELGKSMAKTQKRNAKLFEEWSERIIEALEEQAESNREMTRVLQSYLSASEGDRRQAGEDEETRSPSGESSARYEEGSDAEQGSAAEQEATDAAERKAEELDVDLDEVEGTGSGGRIVVGDVEEASD